MVYWMALCQGPESRHAPYLDTMPVQHDCTLLWGMDDMAELQGAQPALTSFHAA